MCVNIYIEYALLILPLGYFHTKMGYFSPVESNVHLSGKCFMPSLENSPLLLIRELSFDMILIVDFKLLANWVASVQSDNFNPYKATIPVCFQRWLLKMERELGFFD